MTVKADGSFAIGDDPVTRDSLVGALSSVTSGNKDERIFVRGDRAVAYGEVMGLMNVLRDNGYLKIALVGMESRDAK